VTEKGTEGRTVARLRSISPLVIYAFRLQVLPKSRTALVCGTVCSVPILLHFPVGSRARSLCLPLASGHRHVRECCRPDTRPVPAQPRNGRIEAATRAAVKPTKRWFF
jgi:hypothetical protein